jgi:hypothetical protein
VLLADHELGLSGEQATGAHMQEGITTAGALRKFIALLPTKEEDGKLRLLLSEQSLSSDDHGRPGGAGGEQETDSDKHKKSLASATGLELPQRTRRRYSGGRRPVTSGGDG